MKKNADISMETLLTTIIAVIGILFIAFLGVKLYNFFISQDEKNQIEFIEGLNEKIKLLENGEEGKFLLRGVNVKRDNDKNPTILMGWSKSQTVKDDGKPEKCFFDACICIVESGKNVQDAGYCRKVDRENVIVNSSLVYGAEVGVGVVDDSIFETKAKCILFNNELNELNIVKNKSDIWISNKYTFTFSEDKSIKDQRIGFNKILIDNCRTNTNKLSGELRAYPYQGGSPPA